MVEGISKGTSTAHNSKQFLFKKCIYQLWSPSGICLGSFTVPRLHNKAIKYSDVHHFADDINLLSDKSLKKINKQINHDLKLQNIWLSANNISSNASKTEIILFRPKS